MPASTRLTVAVLTPARWATSLMVAGPARTLICGLERRPTRLRTWLGGPDQPPCCLCLRSSWRTVGEHATRTRNRFLSLAAGTVHTSRSTSQGVARCGRSGRRHRMILDGEPLRRPADLGRRCGRRTDGTGGTGTMRSPGPAGCDHRSRPDAVLVAGPQFTRGSTRGEPCVTADRNSTFGVRSTLEVREPDAQLDRRESGRPGADRSGGPQFTRGSTRGEPCVTADRNSTFGVRSTLEVREPDAQLDRRESRAGSAGVTTRIGGSTTPDRTAAAGPAAAAGVDPRSSGAWIRARLMQVWLGQCREPRSDHTPRAHSSRGRQVCGG